MSSSCVWSSRLIAGSRKQDFSRTPAGRGRVSEQSGSLILIFRIRIVRMDEGGRHCEERSSEAIQTRIALPVDCFPLCLRLAAGMTAAELVRVKDSIPRERASHGGLEVPAYELRLAVGSGLFEDVLGVGACGCAGNPKPEGGNAKACARNDCNEKALFGWSEPEPNGEAPSGGVKTSGRINHEKRGRGSFGIKNCDSTVGRDRENGAMSGCEPGRGSSVVPPASPAASVCRAAA